MPLTVCFAWCAHYAVTAYFCVDSFIPPSFPFSCNETGNYALFVQYVLCAMYVQITKRVYKKNVLWGDVWYFHV